MKTGRSASEARFDRLSDSYYAAMRRLLRTPAPDVAALAQKLELAVAEEIFTLTGGDACLNALLRDARRLAAPA
jgi:DNA-directed RNA polymerase specialized sigma24 family protein